MTVAAEVLTYTAPDAEQKKTAYVGMTVFMAGWTMMFGVLFFIYGALRISANAWPPLGLPILPLGWATLNTVVLLLSSVAFEWGLHGIRRGKPKRLGPGILAAMLLGLVFCAIQYQLALDLFAMGLSFDRGAYAAVLYGFSIIHAAHVVIGVLPLLVLAIRAFRGAYTTPQHLAPRLWGVYWHYVGFIWLLIYLLIFVL